MVEGRELDDALNELYGVPPAEFVGTRKALVAEVRAGDPEAAKQLAAARRPTTAAWSLNRLARDHPGLVDDLLDRSVELRAIQARATSGTADELRQASADRRASLNAAADAAVTLAGEIATNPESHRDAIAATLESGSVDETIGAALRAGRLVREAIGAVGFPEIAPLTLVAQPKGKPRRAEPAAADGGEDAESAEAQAALEQAEAHLRCAQQHASELAVAAGEADQRVEDRRSELEAAQAALREAQAEARRANSERVRAQRAATAAEHTADKARKRVG